MVEYEPIYAALGIELVGRGAERSAHCFVNPGVHSHEDRNRSCNVNVETGRFCCQGCDAAGHVYEAAIARGMTPADAMAFKKAQGLVEDGSANDHRNGSARNLRALPRHDPKPSGLPAAITDELLLELHRDLLADASALDAIERERGWSRKAVETLQLGIAKRERIPDPASNEDAKRFLSFRGRRLTFGYRKGGLLIGIGAIQPSRLRRAEYNEERFKVAALGSRSLFPDPATLDLEPGAVLVVVEGEGDLITATSAGLSATAITGTGSGARQAAELAEFAQQRTDVSLAVVLDCDEPGRHASKTVCAALTEAGAQVVEIRLDDLPGIEEGADLSDYLLDGWRGAVEIGDLDSARASLREAGTTLVDVIVPALVRTPSQRQVAGSGDVLDHAETFIRRYAVMSEAQYVAVTLWAAHTHVFDAFETTPYLSITSAEKASGKSRLLEILEPLVASPWFTGHASPAVLVRRIDKERPTLLLDETDAAFNGPQEFAETLRGVLNTGFRSNGSYSVCVAKGDDYKDFGTFCPKAIAGLKDAPDTVASRSILIRMKPKAPGESVARFRIRTAAKEGGPLGRALANWITLQAAALGQARPELPEELSDRQQDGWEPLLAIADAAGGAWPARARAAALELATDATTSHTASLGVQMLRDLRLIFDADNAIALSSNSVCRLLNELDEAPWGGWNKSQGIQQRNVAKYLHEFGVKSRSVRDSLTGDNLKGYHRDQLVEPWVRWVDPSEGSQATQASQPALGLARDVTDVTDVSLLSTPTEQDLRGAA